MNAIITGASKGIGKAIAEKLVCEGMNVAICSRNETELSKTIADLQQLNPAVKVFGQCHDISKKEEAISFGNAALDSFKTIHLFINNAGTFIPGDICTEEDGILETLMGINLYSAYHLTRVIAPAMMKNDMATGSRGHIMNMSSVAGLKAYAQGGSYSISKYAMEGFSKNLREELKAYFIKVTTINPGATMSDSWNGSGVEASRIMKASDIADLIWTVFNLSPQAVVEEIVLRPQLGDL